MNCTACGRLALPSDKFCASCGDSLQVIGNPQGSLPTAVDMLTPTVRPMDRRDPPSPPYGPPHGSTGSQFAQPNKPRSGGSSRRAWTVGITSGVAVALISLVAILVSRDGSFSSRSGSDTSPATIATASVRNACHAMYSARDIGRGNEEGWSEAIYAADDAWAEAARLDSAWETEQVDWNSVRGYVGVGLTPEQAQATNSAFSSLQAACARVGS